MKKPWNSDVDLFTWCIAIFVGLPALCLILKYCWQILTQFKFQL